MLFSERVILPSNATTNTLRNSSNNNSKYEYISDKLNSLNNNNSTSSSISSNSSSSSSSSATNSSLNGNNTYIEPKYSQLFQMKPPNTPGTPSKNPVFNSPRFNYLTLSPNIRRNQINSNNNNSKIDDQSSQYSKKCDLLNLKENKYEQRQSLIINNKSKTNQLNDRLLVVQAKMSPTDNLGTQIRNKPNKQQSSSSYTYHTYNPNRLSSYDNDIYDYNNTNSAQPLTPKQQKSDDLEMMYRKNTLPTSQRASIAIPSSKQSNIHLLKSCVNNNNTSSKTTSSSNLFTRAFNYAFKKNQPNINHHHSIDNSAKLSWKSKLGKFFPQSVSTRKLNKEEGCDIIDDDLYESATYHLSRRQPIKQKQSFNDNLISTCSPLANNNSNETNLSCLAGNNSSSAFSASFNDNTPYLSNQTSQNNKKSSSSSKRSRAKCLEKTSSSTTNLNRSSPCLNKELTKNTNIINNGFNSLRKILKISNKQQQIQNSKATHKCSSASSTPVPPSMKINSFEKLKETQLITNSPITQVRSSLSSSNASLLHKPQQQQQFKDNDSAASKYSISKNGSNLTKSIINQTSSTFSSYSASLSSSLNDATSNKSKSNIIDNLEQVNNIKELDETKISLNLTKQDSSEIKVNNSITTKLEEDKTKALKMLDYYKNSLSQNESNSKDVSKSNEANNVKISSTEIFLTKNILINNDDSDYYEISKKTTENENHFLNTNTATTATNNNNNNIIVATKMQSNDELVSTTTNTTGSKTASISNSTSMNQRVKPISNDEEILCDLEVASYFDEKQKFKNTDEDSYYYENNQNENSESKSSNNDDFYDEDDEENDEDDDDDDILDDVIDDELDNQVDVIEEDEIDEDSNNLEYLVRQLAAEATLSLNGKKINVNNSIKNSYNNYDNKIMNKKLEKDYPYEATKPCILKNKIFNCENNNINKKYLAKNQNNLISDEEEELIYDLESNFGLNDYINDVYNDDKMFIKSKNSKNEINKYDDEYDCGSYSKSDTSDSLNGNKTSTLSFNILNGETLFKNNNNNINGNVNKYNGKGFSSLRNKSKPNIYNINPNLTINNTNQFYDKKQFELNKKTPYLANHKRSSSSSSCQQSHIVKLINHQQLQSQQQQHQLQRSLAHKSRKDNDFNSNIKIEKKIRLNYNRPQNFNSILNFGTLC